MVKKQIIYRLDPKSDEYKWYKKQKNKQKSFEVLIDLAIKQFGITDINKNLIVKTDYQLLQSESKKQNHSIKNKNFDDETKYPKAKLSGKKLKVKQKINKNVKLKSEDFKDNKDSGSNNFGIPGLS